MQKLSKRKHERKGRESQQTLKYLVCIEDMKLFSLGLFYRGLRCLCMDSYHWALLFNFYSFQNLPFFTVQVTRIYRQCLRKHFKISEMHFSSDAIMICFQILSSHRSKWLKDDNNFTAFTSSEDFLAPNESSSHPKALVRAAIPNKVGKCPQLCIIFEKNVFSF